MDERPSGWYDDPQEPSRLRYWDGASWTERTHEKAPIPAPQEPKPVSRLRPARDAAPEGPPCGDDGERGGRPLTASDSPRPWSTTSGRRDATASATADVPPAAYGRRVLAVVIDVVLVWVVSTIVMSVIVSFSPDSAAAIQAYGQQALDAMRSGAVPPEPSPMMTALATTIQLVFAGLLVLYDALQIMHSGSTLGGRIMGIRVRPHDSETPVGGVRLLLRSLLKYALFVLTGALSTLGLAFAVVDAIWPLNDARRRALHDKWTGTEVVRRR